MSRANEPNYFKGFNTGQPTVDDWFKPVQPKAVEAAPVTKPKYNCDTCEDSGEDVLLEEGQVGVPGSYTKYGPCLDCKNSEVKLSASWTPWKIGTGKPLELFLYAGPLELCKRVKGDIWLKVVFIQAHVVDWYSDSEIIAWRKSND